MLDEVLDALRALRSPFALHEADIHGQVGRCLREAGLSPVHELSLIHI